MMQDSPQEIFSFLKQNIKTLQLSTLSAAGRPNASYSPFVMDDSGNFYIFISQLASHTQDLLCNAEVSILLIQDERDANQLFARQRISYQCGVEVITPDSDAYEPMLTVLQQRFGGIVKMLRALPDFILMRLRPYSGQFIKGFGQAYNLEGKHLTELKHIDLSTH